MEGNPYAAPASGDVIAASLPPGFGPPQPWEWSEVLSTAYESFKRDWAILIGSTILVYALGFSVGFLSARVFRNPLDSQAELVSALRVHQYLYIARESAIHFVADTVIETALTAFLTVGLTRMYLASARGQKPEFEMLFGGFDRHIVYVAVSLTVIATTYVGLALLIIPGAIVGASLYFALACAVDTTLGPIACLRTAWQITAGQRLKLTGLMIMVGLVMYSGVFACGVGLLASIPLTGVVGAVAYTRLTGTAPARA